MWVVMTSVFTLKMEAARSSETFVSYHITRHRNLKDVDVNLHRRENLKPHILADEMGGAFSMHESDEKFIKIWSKTWREDAIQKTYA
jgi:hypothetical protein